MDFSKLSQNNWIAGGGALLALLALFFPWYGTGFGGDLSGFNVSINGWSSGLAAWLGCLLGVAAGALIVLKVMDIFEANVGGLETEQFAMILGGLGLVLVLLRFLTQTSGSKIGLYLGIIGVGAAAAGAFLSAKDKGIGVPTGADFGGGSTGDGNPTTF